MDLSELHLHWRPGSYKGKTDKSYSLARAYHQDGKNLKEIVVKLGTLTDQEATKWRGLLNALKKPDSFVADLDDLAITAHYAYLDVAAANAIWDEWQLDQVFSGDGKRPLGIATVARILTVNRCIDPAAKSTIPKWVSRTALPWLLEVDPSTFNSSRVFRELAEIESHKDAICQALFDKVRADHPESLTAVFYDLSPTTFSGSQCVLMKWGIAKKVFATTLCSR